jgi:hypothetical protein
MRSLVNAIIAVLYRGQNTVLGSFGGLTFGSPAKRFCEAILWRIGASQTSQPSEY